MNDDTKKALDIIWGFGAVSPLPISDTVKWQNGQHHVYGEITKKGTEILLDKFKDHFSNSDGVFYDLGSGHGKLVMHIAAATPFKRSCGIELSSVRLARAKKTLSENPTLGGDTDIVFLEKNYFKHDFSDATVVYIDNTMFYKPEDTLQIEKKIYNKLPVGCLFIHKIKFKNITEPADGTFPIVTTYNRNHDLESYTGLQTCNFTIKK